MTRLLLALLLPTALLASEKTRLLSAHQLRITSPSFAVKQNMDIASEELDQTIINPGQRFSLNEALGKRTSEKGYKKARVFSGTGDAMDELGGGLCMISTLLYNVFARAGLRVVERHPHQQVVGYAKPGFDAAVNWGTKDLVIINNHSAPIRLQLMRQGNSLRARLVSTMATTAEVELKRTVKRAYIAGRSQRGFRVRTTRTFFRKGRLLKEEVLSEDSFKAVDR